MSINKSSVSPIMGTRFWENYLSKIIVSFTDYYNNPVSACMCESMRECARTLAKWGHYFERKQAQKAREKYGFARFVDGYDFKKANIAYRKNHYRKVWLCGASCHDVLAEKGTRFDGKKTTYIPIYNYPFEVSYKLESGLYKRVGFGIPTIEKYVDAETYFKPETFKKSDYNGKSAPIFSRNKELEREYGADIDTDKYYLETGIILDKKVPDNTHNTNDKSAYILAHNPIIEYIARRVQKSVQTYAIKQGYYGKSFDILKESYAYFSKDKVINTDFSDMVNICADNLFLLAKRNGITLVNLVNCMVSWANTTDKNDKNRYNYTVTFNGIKAQQFYSVVNKSVDKFFSKIRHFSVSSRIAYYTDNSGNATNKPVPNGQIASAIKAHTAKYVDIRVLSFEQYTADMGDCIPGHENITGFNNSVRDMRNLCNTADLTAKERDIFILIVYLGYTKRALAIHFNLSEQRVGQIFQSARKKLKKYVHNAWFCC